MNESTETPAWSGIVTGAGLALALVAALSLVGVIAQGFAVTEDTGFIYKLGIAFLRNLDYTPAGLMALVAVTLAAAPAFAKVTTTPKQNRQVSLTFTLAALVCVVVVLGTVLGVLTRLHFDKNVTSATRLVLATFAVRSMGPALVAFGVAMAALPGRSPGPVTPAPYAEGSGTDTGAGAEPGPGTGSA